MVGYNLTQIASNSTGMVGLTQGVNDVLMYGWFGTGFLLAMFVMMVIGFYFATKDIGKSISAGSFLSFILAIFLMAMNLINPKILYVTLICSAISLVFLWKNN